MKAIMLADSKAERHAPLLQIRNPYTFEFLGLQAKDVLFCIPRFLQPVLHCYVTVELKNDEFRHKHIDSSTPMSDIMPRMKCSRATIHPSAFYLVFVKEK